MSRRANKTGRTGHGGAFVQLHQFMMETTAWRSLKPAERAVYVELARRYNGQNNGYLALSVRDAQDACLINKDTAAKSLRRLEELGFIDQTQAGSFSYKARHAALYRLTQHKCDRTGDAGSKRFLKWRPEEKAGPSKPDSRSPHIGPRARVEALTVPSFRTVGAV